MQMRKVNLDNESKRISLDNELEFANKQISTLKEELEKKSFTMADTERRLLDTISKLESSN